MASKQIEALAVFTKEDGLLHLSGIQAQTAVAPSMSGSMTEGQEAMGSHPVRDVVAGLLASGVKRVIVTTENLARYENVSLPADSEVWGRERVLEAQAALAGLPVRP